MCSKFEVVYGEIKTRINIFGLKIWATVKPDSDYSYVSLAFVEGRVGARGTLMDNEDADVLCLETQRPIRQQIDLATTLDGQAVSFTFMVADLLDRDYVVIGLDFLRCANVNPKSLPKPQRERDNDMDLLGARGSQTLTGAGLFGDLIARQGSAELNAPAAVPTLSIASLLGESGIEQNRSAGEMLSLPTLLGRPLSVQDRIGATAVADAKAVARTATLANSAALTGAKPLKSLWEHMRERDDTGEQADDFVPVTARRVPRNHIIYRLFDEEETVQAGANTGGKLSWSTLLRRPVTVLDGFDEPAGDDAIAALGSPPFVDSNRSKFSFFAEDETASAAANLVALTGAKPSISSLLWERMPERDGVEGTADEGANAVPLAVPNPSMVNLFAEAGAKDEDIKAPAVDGANGALTAAKALMGLSKLSQFAQADGQTLTLTGAKDEDGGNGLAMTAVKALLKLSMLGLFAEAGTAQADERISALHGGQPTGPKVNIFDEFVDGLQVYKVGDAVYAPIGGNQKFLAIMPLADDQPERNDENLEHSTDEQPVEDDKRDDSVLSDAINNLMDDPMQAANQNAARESASPPVDELAKALSEMTTNTSDQRNNSRGMCMLLKDFSKLSLPLNDKMKVVYKAIDLRKKQHITQSMYQARVNITNYSVTVKVTAQGLIRLYVLPYP